MFTKYLPDFSNWTLKEWEGVKEFKFPNKVEFGLFSDFI